MSSMVRPKLKASSSGEFISTLVKAFFLRALTSSGAILLGDFTNITFFSSAFANLFEARVLARPRELIDEFYLALLIEEDVCRTHIPDPFAQSLKLPQSLRPRKHKIPNLLLTIEPLFVPPLLDLETENRRVVLEHQLH